MATRRKPARGKSRKLTPYQQCMSKEIPKERKILMKKLHKEKLAPKEAGQALKNAAHTCSK